MFADDVVKINRKQKRQDRVLVLTNKALYNFAPGSYKSAKRRILMRELRGVILSRCSDELVFQVSDSYDYRYEIRRRSEVLEMLSKAYEREMDELHGSPQSLMVTFSEEKELKDMVITKDLFKTFQAKNPNVSGHQPVQVDIIDGEREDGAPGALRDGRSPSHTPSASHSGNTLNAPSTPSSSSSS